jgi:hypothetical protein
MATIIYDGIELGFGSPTVVDSSIIEQDYHDSGFGAPDAISLNGDEYTNSAEQAFGDPYVSINIDIVNPEGGYLLSDDGGNILELRGDFSQIFDSFGIVGDKTDKILGPLSATFFNNSDNSINYDALSGMPQGGNNLFIQSNQKQMFLCTPSMVKGEYSLVLTWKSVQSITLPFTFTVVNRLRNDKVFSIRNNLPSYWNVGQKSDNYVNIDQYYPKTESNLAVLTSVFGTAFNSIYDSNYTITTSMHKRGDSTLSVESTLGFNNSGSIKLDNGQKITYTGKTPTSFTGVSLTSDLIEKGSRVQQIDTTLSLISDYYKIQNNGFYVPSKGIRKDDFLNAFNVIDMNERHSTQVIFQYLYKIFKGINLVKTATITDGVISAPTEGSWNNSHCQRICRVDQKFYYIEQCDISGLNTLTLDPTGCSYWQSSSEIENGEYEIEVLPWTITEDYSGRFTITLEKTCFNAVLGYVDKDYIDFNIYIDGDNFENNIRNNLNLDLFVASGIIESIQFKRKSTDLFGTYFTQEAAEDGLKIVPDYDFA